MKKKRISLVLLAFDKGIASTVIGPLEIFQYANLLAAEKYPELLSPFFNVKVCSIDGSPVRCSEKVLIEPDCSLDDVKDTDLVLICSPGILTEETWRKHTRLFPKLKDLHEAGSALAGICT
ncbi:DJ-1/PfpI family protein, partial [bacterium]|nr:DJ-1/PfpI family protein [bacterium]